MMMAFSKTTFAIAVCLLSVISAIADEAPAHLTLARELVKSVSPERNLYSANPTKIVWPDEATPSQPALNNSVCSSFCAALLRKSYQLGKPDLIHLFTEEWPEADEMFVGASTKRDFEVIESINAIKPGDFIIVDYLSEKAIPTGHVMLISGDPKKVKLHSKLPLPFEFATGAKSRDIEVQSAIEWEVNVIDSSKSPHGKNDTRYQSADGENDSGIGEGPIRLLTDKNGKWLGYTWSMFSNSRLWLVGDRPIVVARWKN